MLDRRDQSSRRPAPFSAPIVLSEAESGERARPVGLHNSAERMAGLHKLRDVDPWRDDERKRSEMRGPSQRFMNDLSSVDVEAWSRFKACI